MLDLWNTVHSDREGSQVKWIPWQQRGFEGLITLRAARVSGAQPGARRVPRQLSGAFLVSKTHQEMITHDLKQVWSASPVESRGVTHHHLKVSWSSFLDITESQRK